MFGCPERNQSKHPLDYSHERSPEYSQEYPQGHDLAQAHFGHVLILCRTSECHCLSSKHGW